MNILVLSKIWQGAIEHLQENHECTVEINPETEKKKELIENAEVVVIRSPVKLDKETLSAAKKLKLIVRAGMGLDTIDIDYAKEKGIQVVIVPLSSESVAEHVLALVLSIYRNTPWFHQSLKENKWEKHGFLGEEIHGKKIGLVGFGRIGIRIAEIAKAFNMDIYAFDRSPEKPHKKEAAEKLHVKFVSVDELFKVSDIISIQTPLNESTRNLASKERIDLMKKEAILINVGRGKIIDEEALYNALKEEKIRGAALDVFASEPPKDSPLFTLKNFVGTPHVAAQTREAQKKIGDDVLQIINAFEKNEDIGKYCMVV